MKIVCLDCRETFDIPDGGFNKIHCPFCDSTHTLKQSEFEAAKKSVASVNLKDSSSYPAHPLQGHLRVLAVCAVIIAVAVTIIALCEVRRTIQELYNNYQMNKLWGTMEPKLEELQSQFNGLQQSLITSSSGLSSSLGKMGKTQPNLNFAYPPATNVIHQTRKLVSPKP
ncbi:MAG: hypothetical protein WCP12_10290 [bacterium]